MEEIAGDAAVLAEEEVVIEEVEEDSQEAEDEVSLTSPHSFNSREIEDLGRGTL